MISPRKKKRARFLSGSVAALALFCCGRQAWSAPPVSFPDEQTVALWLFDDEPYPHTPLLDSSLGEYDLRLLRGRLTRGKYGGAVHCDPMAGGYNVYFSEWEGEITAQAMRIFAPEPSGLWGPTLVPDRLLEALAGGAWTCEFWIQAFAPGDDAQATILDMGWAYDPGFSVSVSNDGRTLQVENAYAGQADHYALEDVSVRRWRHVALSYSRHRGLQCFVDGASQKSLAQATTALRASIPQTLQPVSLSSQNYCVFDASQDHERFRVHRFNLALGEDRRGDRQAAFELDELRFSAVSRYENPFSIPGSWARNQRHDASRPAVPSGPPPLAELIRAAEPIAFGRRKHVFIDAALLEQAQGVELGVHAPRRLEILLSDAGFRGDYSVVDMGDKIYLYAMDGYGSKEGVTRLFVSSDGLTFTAPELGLVEYEGGRQNNILIKQSPMWARAFRDDNPGAHADEHYKMTGWLANRGIAMHVSPDGLHWRRNEVLMAPLVSGGGAETFWDDQYGRYVTFLKRDGSYHGAACPTAHGRVACALTTVEPMKGWPFLKIDPPYYEGWATPALTCEGPIAFPVTARGQVYRTRAQKYPWAPDAYVAFVWRMGADNVRETELVVSRNGLDWSLAGDNGTYLAKNSAAQGRRFAEGMVQDGLIRRGDEIWHYAECNTGAHGAGERFQVRAVQRLDGFTSLSASKAGVAVTRPLVLEGDRLLVNADVRGEIRVEIRNCDGTPMTGFEANASLPLTGDSVRHEVRWGGGAAFGSLAGRPLRIAFLLNDADLYAFETSDAIDVTER